MYVIEFVFRAFQVFLSAPRVCGELKWQSATAVSLRYLCAVFENYSTPSQNCRRNPKAESSMYPVPRKRFDVAVAVESPAALGRIEAF
jgi:hypothetical protein